MGISKLTIVCCIAILYTCLVEHVVRGDLSDQSFLDQFDDIIKDLACQASTKTLAVEMKVNLTRYSTREELAKMAFWNYGHDFSVKKLEFGEDLKWKRDLVDTLFDIFIKSCPTSAVPHGFMNIFREFTMIYLNSVEPNNPSNNTDAWKSIQSILDTCKDSVTPYELALKELKVNGIQGKVDDMTEHTVLYPPEEKVDLVYTELDQVVENLWFVFSHAMGKCFPTMPRPAEVAPKIKALFFHDILKPLMNRWGDPGPLQDFGPIVGNYNIDRVQRNIRFCVTAGYFLNGITELQMVRPLRVGHVHDGRNTILNRKTGATFQ